MPSTNANITAGPKTRPIRTPAIMLSKSHGITRHRVCLPMPPRRKSERSWIRSETHVPNARQSEGARQGHFLRASFFSTLPRTLPTFLTAFFTAVADFPVFLDS
jgi:hypothetical protein